MKTFKLLILIGVLAAGLAGCSTPQARIARNPEIFARLTPAEQETIKKGEVSVGFDQEMVKLALGEPDRVRSRTDATGKSEIWSYVTYESPDGLFLYRGFYHRYYGYDAFYPYYLSYPTRRDREHLRVVFDRNGKVTSIEQETRGGW
jgi:outer membrane protein assembly factor BamE (lipoprotein component of BamABCDE complex)